jgi:hypothetical protein
MKDENVSEVVQLRQRVADLEFELKDLKEHMAELKKRLPPDRRGCF